MSIPTPTHDTLKAKVARRSAPGYGWCARCGLPWKYVDGHCVDFAAGRGCFPLCEACWDLLSPQSRLPYYLAHVEQYYGEDEASTIRRAILAGDRS